MKTVKTLVRYSLFGAACSTVVIATGSLVVLPICLLCFAPVFLGDGR